MERTQLFDLMGELKLYGMKAAFDEIMATAVKRQHVARRWGFATHLINNESDPTQDRGPMGRIEGPWGGRSRAGLTDSRRANKHSRLPQNISRLAQSGKCPPSH